MTDAQQQRYEAKIRDLEAAAQRMAATAIDDARRYAADLTAARGAILRLRCAVLEGAADTEQAWAVESAASVITEPGSVSHAPATFRICAAFLALHEGHKATLARLRKIADLACLPGATDTK